MMQNFLDQFFGGRRSFLRTIYYASRARIGAYASYQKIEWSIVSRVIFVCKGNICRSPYAERKFISLGGSAISAGLEADRKPADPNAQYAAQQRHVNLKNHLSQSIQQLKLEAGDLLIAFEPDHAGILTELASDVSNVQVTLLGLWTDNYFWVYLHDPYGLSRNYFNNCFNRIDSGLTRLLNCLNTHAGRITEHHHP